VGLAAAARMNHTTLAVNVNLPVEWSALLTQIAGHFVHD
jgi:hypothetical protein